MMKDSNNGSRRSLLTYLILAAAVGGVGGGGYLTISNREWSDVNDKAVSEKIESVKVQVSTLANSNNKAHTEIKSALKAAENKADAARAERIQIDKRVTICEQESQHISTSLNKMERRQEQFQTMQSKTLEILQAIDAKLEKK